MTTPTKADRAAAALLTLAAAATLTWMFENARSADAAVARTLPCVEADDAREVGIGTGTWRPADERALWERCSRE